MRAAPLLDQAHTQKRQKVSEKKNGASKVVHQNLGNEAERGAKEESTKKQHGRERLNAKEASEEERTRKKKKANLRTLVCFEVEGYFHN